MSVAAVAWALEQPVCPPPRKLVLVTLATWADAEGLCWPKQSVIAGQVGIGVRMVKKHLRVLVAEGYVNVTNRGQRGNVYNLPIKGNSSALVAETAVPPSNLVKGNSSASPTDTTVPLSVLAEGNSSAVAQDGLRGTPVQFKGNSSADTSLLNRKEPLEKDSSRTRPRARESPAWLKRLSLDAWKKLTPLHITELQEQAGRLGVDIAVESLACEDYYRGNRRAIKAPYAALKNWLNKAAQIKGDRSGNARTDSQTGHGNTGADGERSYGGWSEIIANRGRRPA